VSTVAYVVGSGACVGGIGDGVDGVKGVVIVPDEVDKIVVEPGETVVTS
jgi:hypothetical protein